MSDIYQAMNFLSEDLDAMERAAKAAGSSSIPANLRLSLLKTLGKLMKILGADEYPYPKPEGYEKPAYPEPEKPKNVTTTVNDRERKKSVRIKFVDRAAEAEKAAPPARPSNIVKTPVSSKKYAQVLEVFGEDFARRYYADDGTKETTGYEPVETIDHYFGISEKTAQRRLEGQQRLAEQRQREAAEEAQRRRVVAGIASLFDSSAQ